MERESERTRGFTRRAVFVGLLQASALAGLGTRLAWLEIAEGRKYRTLSENNRISMRMLAPSRGLILDRTGRIIAGNDQNFRAVLIPEQVDDKEDALRKLGRFIAITDKDVQRVLRQARKQPHYMPAEVKENLSWDEVSAIEVHLPDLPGISTDEGEIRVYPYSDAMVHITGYVGAVNKAEINDDPLLSMPDFHIGKAGIEKTFEPQLRGKAGAAEVEVNVLGREVRELGRTPGVPGKPVRLTIDADLQTYTHQRLSQERSAGAIVLDAVTGAIYALGSFPGYDPNIFVRGVPNDIWQALLKDPSHPLNNKAVNGQYPPGSTFKIATATALLESGRITRHSTQFCPGYFDFGGNRFHCWKKTGHGTVNVVQALEQSCDTFFYKNAVDLGIDTLAEYATRLGLGAKLDIGMDEERPGLMPTRAWKMGRMSQSWHPGETVVASIGQGYTLTTLLQLAVMTARVSSGGRAIRPSLTMDAQQAGPTIWPSLGFKPDTMSVVMEGMNDVMNSPRGTARASRIADPAFAMAGKTGTAQVRRITKEQRTLGTTEDQIPWHLRHHALFVGFAPVYAPRYVTSVIVEHGGGGSTVAAPIARDLLLAAQKLDPGRHMSDPALQALRDAAAPVVKKG